MSEQSILLVEDNPGDEELTLRALKKNNILNTVVVVRAGADALDYLFAKGAHAGRTAALPHIVLLDLNLPKISGVDLLKAIRAEPATKLLPVIILTSSRQERDLTTGYDLGAN